MKYLRDVLKRLEVDAGRHKERLQENAALLQFMWKADVVDSWIGTCMMKAACSKMNDLFRRKTSSITY